MHFGIKDFECDQCDMKFPTKGELNKHYQKHEGIIYNCLICKTYEANNLRTMDSHLRKKHTDIVGNNFNRGVAERYVKIMNNILWDKIINFDIPSFHCHVLHYVV